MTLRAVQMGSPLSRMDAMISSTPVRLFSRQGAAKRIDSILALHKGRLRFTPTDGTGKRTCTHDDVDCIDAPLCLAQDYLYGLHTAVCIPGHLTGQEEQAE